MPKGLARQALADIGDGICAVGVILLILLIMGVPGVILVIVFNGPVWLRWVVGIPATLAVLAYIGKTGREEPPQW